MTFPVTKIVFASTRASSFPLFKPQEWKKVAYYAQRWNSSYPLGSAPSQLPVPGENGWAQFIENVERIKLQPSLSPSEVQQGQSLYRMEKKLENLQTLMSSLLKSNQSLTTQISQLIQVIKPN